MFEIIAVIFVCWIGFAVLRGLFRGISGGNSKEFGKESRRIAVVDLKVPNSYYNHLVLNNMAGVKDAALNLLDNNDFKGTSWPRLIALVIYGEFHQDCEQWHLGSPIQEQLFDSIGVTPVDITNELNRDAQAVFYGNL